MEKISFLCFACTLSLLSSAQPPASGIVKGVVTYFFNKYQGDKPDLGSEVWLTDTSTVQGFDQKLFDTVYRGGINRSFVAAYNDMGKPVPANILKTLHDYGADNEVFYKDADKRNAIQLLKVRAASDKAQHSTVDGTGSFNFSAPAGTYYLLIKSNGRSGGTMTDIMGKMYLQKVKIVNGGFAEVSHKFDQY